MPTTFPVLLANGFIELGALAVDGTLNAVTASWAMMIDWLRTGVQGDDVTHAAEDLESIPRLMIKLFERCIPLSRVNSLL